MNACSPTAAPSAMVYAPVALRFVTTAYVPTVPFVPEPPTEKDWASWRDFLLRMGAHMLFQLTKTPGGCVRGAEGMRTCGGSGRQPRRGAEVYSTTQHSWGGEGCPPPPPHMLQT